MGTAMDGQLKKEFEYYLTHQEEFVRQYEGKVIVLKEHKVLGVYEDTVSAVTATQREHKLGTFLVQKVAAGNAATSQTYHSRVVFS